MQQIFKCIYGEPSIDGAPLALVGDDFPQVMHKLVDRLDFLPCP